MSASSAFALDQAGWPAFLVDSEGLIVRANKAAGDALGDQIAAGSTRFETLWPAENATSANQFLARASTDPALTFPTCLRLKTGLAKRFLLTAFSFVESDRRLLVVQCLPDYSPQPAAAADTANLHKQKLDCALQMARTVALDFNNALTSILGHASLLLARAEKNHPYRTSLLEIEKSASKAAEIASDLGNFSRQEKETRAQQSGNLNHLVQRAVEVIQQRQLPGPIEWVFQLEKRLHAAKFDEAKLQQALVKITENAAEALKNGGRISLQSRNLNLSGPTQDRDVKLAAGSYVCAEITDNGPGIPEADLNRVFEPFFTTKHGHRGLGLAWAYGIISNHGGGIAISSNPGSGAAVRIYLPAEKRVILDDPNVTDADLTGQGTILMVDDEDLMLTLGQTILSSYGYTVITANSGQRALDLLSDKSKTVHLLITDLVMPGMSGRELIEHVRTFLPRTKILTTSGYVRTNDQAHDTAYLQKPFTSKDLLLKVKQLLSGS